MNPIPTPPSAHGGDQSLASARREILDHLLQHHRDLLLHPQRHQAELAQAIDTAIAHSTVPPAHAERLSRELRDQILGAGHLQRFLEDKGITEIMVSGAQVIVERDGRLQEVEGFQSDEDAYTLAETMALRQGERLQLAQPILDFGWIDGSRVNVVHPILAGGKVAITIRKPDRSRPLDLGSLVAGGTLTERAADLLVSAVAHDRRNLLITGAQGSGKTTLLRALLQDALRDAPLRRVVQIEDTPELHLQHRHVIALRARAASQSRAGAQAVTLQDLTRAAKRQRPDLVIVGEVRGAEGVELIALAQSEATGVLGTLHIARPEDLPGRFYYFGTLAGIGITPADMTSWVFATFHIVCHLERDEEGRRRVTRIVSLDQRTETMVDLYRLEGGDLREVAV